MFSFDNSPDPTALNAQAQEHVRAMVEWKRQDNILAHNAAVVRPIFSVGIIGAGVMGAEIAATHIKHNLPVTIFDNNPAALQTIVVRTTAELVVDKEFKDLNTPVHQLLYTVAELSEIAKCDLIIESILEKLPAKQELFGRLNELLAPDAILVSNTSTIPIGNMAESVTSPERFCGFHFCHPVRQRPIVEIVRGAKTSDETIAALAAHANTIEKLPIVVADGPGFLINRLLLPYLAEALELLMEGASIEEIESAAVEFGMAKGPFRLMDEIGLDTTLHAGWSMASAFPSQIPISPLLVALIKRGRLGQKSGAGFFSYPARVLQENSPVSVMQKLEPLPEDYSKPDPAAIEIIARWVKTPKPHSAEDIVWKLIMPMILEAGRILEDGVAADPRDIDLGTIFGLGFPARRGGLLWWAERT